MPYPNGFQHDFSIIAGDNLPQLTNPPNSPRITHWGPYEEVLPGPSAFVNCHSVVTSTFSTREGYGVPSNAQEAIAHGAQYTWDFKTRAPTTALFWLTLHDSDTIQGTSGTILCLGRPSDAHARAVFFQNFDVNKHNDKSELLDSAKRSKYSMSSQSLASMSIFKLTAAC